MDRKDYSHLNLSLTQRLIIECDDYIERAGITGKQARDRAVSAFVAGSLNTLYACGPETTDLMNRASVIALIAMGGYARIHAMAHDLRVGQASLPGTCAHEEGE